MKLTVGKIGKDATVSYAVDELVRCLKAMDSTLFIEQRSYESKDESLKNILWIGLDGTVETAELDEIFIDVKDGRGLITGSGNRAVLIAVYRFLYELGCRFLFPGDEGEYLPNQRFSAEGFCVKVRERAAYRHRGICIEGAVSYEHVYNMINWLPKVGMNGYFMQFRTPSCFFKRFYNSDFHKELALEPINDEDVEHIVSRLEEEIVKRGLDYHATGHGWTCEPFGIHATGWEAYEGTLSEDTVSCLAKINGERSLFGNIALNTNLCYSNPKVRKCMTDAIVEYCKAHPAVNYLHFWLADGTNNHCECENCTTTRPSDYYVMMLNELDRKLTEAGLQTKIVCLIYLDLLWEPEHEKIISPERFVLMFAPITRTYSSSFTDFDCLQAVELVPYNRNKLIMPKSVAENVTRLTYWQKEQLVGDSFDFDYHLMWDHYLDPGYYTCARILHKDMANLYKIGLQGMISCQVQRAAFPNGLPMYAMAKALWQRGSSFENICKEYYEAAYGEKAKEVEAYLSTLSELFDPVYLRNEKTINPEKIENIYQEIQMVIEEFRIGYLEQRKEINASWKYLWYHAEFCKKYADVIKAYRGKDSTEEVRNRAKELLMEYVKKITMDTHNVFDGILFERVFKYFD